MKTWNKELENKITNYQLTKDEVIFAKYIYPKLIELTKIILIEKNYGLDECSINNFSYIISSGLWERIDKWNHEKSSAFTFFYLVALNLIKNELKKEIRYKNRNVRLSELYNYYE